jgi:hypothetical protein
MSAVALSCSVLSYFTKVGPTGQLPRPAWLAEVADGGKTIRLILTLGPCFKLAAAKNPMLLDFMGSLASSLADFHHN